MIDAIRFEVGKTYSAPDLYGGPDWRITVTGRDDNKGEIYYTYDEHTSDDRSIKTAKIETETRHLASEEVCLVEMVLAWEYQSRYAKEGDTDKCYFMADKGQDYSSIQEEIQEDISLD